MSSNFEEKQFKAKNRNKEINQTVNCNYTGLVSQSQQMCYLIKMVNTYALKFSSWNLVVVKFNLFKEIYPILS